MDLVNIQKGLLALGKEFKEGLYEEYLEAKTNFDNLDDQKKTMQAFYEIKHSKEGSTQAEITRNAIADPEYKKFLAGLGEARKEMNQAFAKVKSAEARLKVYQSLNKYITEL